MFGFEFVVLIATLTPVIASGGRYGSRLTSGKSVANSGVDDRIVAILNSGQTMSNYLSAAHRIGVSMGSETVAKTTGRTMSTVNVDTPEEVGSSNPVIEVSASNTPVAIVFRTESPKVHVQQQHNAATNAGVVESTHSEDVLQSVRHEVFRPVVQELTEIIQPYRRLVQYIRPVIEDIQQIVASGQRSAHNSANAAQITAQVSHSSFASNAGFGNTVPMSPQKFVSALSAPQRIASSLRPQRIGSAISEAQEPAVPELAHSYQSKPGAVLAGALSGPSLDLGSKRVDIQKMASNDDYHLSYRVPIGFALVDSNEMRDRLLNRIRSDSTVHELAFSPQELRVQDTKSHNLSANDIKLIKVSFATKSRAQSYS